MPGSSFLAPVHQLRHQFTSHSPPPDSATDAKGSLDWTEDWDLTVDDSIPQESLQDILIRHAKTKGASHVSPPPVYDAGRLSGAGFVQPANLHPAMGDGRTPPPTAPATATPPTVPQAIGQTVDAETIQVEKKKKRRKKTRRLQAAPRTIVVHHHHHHTHTHTHTVQHSDGAPVGVLAAAQPAAAAAAAPQTSSPDEPVFTPNLGCDTFRQPLPSSRGQPSHSHTVAAPATNASSADIAAQVSVLEKRFASCLDAVYTTEYADLVASLKESVETLAAQEEILAQTNSLTPEAEAAFRRLHQAWRSHLADVSLA